jgi:type I restriction enzyme S subunit
MMNPDWLLKHFDQISEAPDAVPRLRRFILDLAVRGKLVEQDPADEPASELLKRIQAKKQKPMRDRGDVKERPPIISEYETPFQIPETWEWVQSTEPAVLISDRGKKIQTKDVLDAGEFPVVDQGKVFIRGYCNDARRVIRVDGPIIIFGDHTRETKLIDFDFVVGADGVKMLKPIEIDPGYYFLALQWVPLDSRGYARHFKLLRASRFPLPPLAEQHRIVAKVDELMALCDEFEAAQAKRERRRDRLVAANLHGLNNGDDSSEPEGRPTFEKSVRFYFNHLPHLTTRPEHIHQLRQTILTLAVRGKLVPQDPNDEPVSELLKRIRTEKDRLIKDGEIKHVKQLPRVRKDEITFTIPEGWQSVRLLELCEVITKGSSPKWQGIEYTNQQNGILFITSENVGNFSLRLQNKKYVHPRFNEIEPRSVLARNDILLNLVGASIGRSAIFDLDVIANINQAVCIVRTISRGRLVCLPYLLIFLNSEFGVSFMLDKQVDMARANLSMGNVSQLPIPLPPLAEQHRIVAKVDELTALCDKLETRLATTATTRRQLLEATLCEAIAS